MKRSLSLIGVAVVIAVLGGCGGGVTTILAALGIIKLHDIYTDVTEEISDNPEDTLTLMIDGYVVRTDVPNRQGRVELNGLPEGRFLLSLISPDYRRGWHALVSIGETDHLEVNPFTGAIISGTVAREASGGGHVNVANALVLAFRDGAAHIADGLGALSPGDAGVSYVLGLSDASGQFKLGPVEYGSWLVIAVLPGYKCDARLVNVSAGHDATGLAFVLTEDENARTATITGTVAREKTGTPLASALVRADLTLPFVPPVSDGAYSRVKNELGRTMREDNWVSVPFVAATTGAAGTYTLRVPVGEMRLWAYKYGYRGAYIDVHTEVGGSLARDFRLKD